MLYHLQVGTTSRRNVQRVVFLNPHHKPSFTILHNYQIELRLHLALAEQLTSGLNVHVVTFTISSIRVVDIPNSADDQLDTLQKYGEYYVVDLLPICASIKLSPLSRLTSYEVF